MKEEIKTTIEVQIGTIKTNYVAVLTDAPESYDGFGTFTLYTWDYPLEGSGCRKNTRLVLCQENHLEWQRNRYWSGLNSASLELESVAGVGASYLTELLYNRIQGRTENS